MSEVRDTSHLTDSDLTDTHITVCMHCRHSAPVLTVMCAVAMPDIFRYSVGLLLTVSHLRVRIH